MPDATSVFFGGGTPSLLDAPQLTAILDAIPRAADAEVTVECNPDSVDLAKLRAYAEAGVNRVSFGVQSMRPHVLAALGRTHDPDNVARAVAWARDAGIDRRQPRPHLRHAGRVGRRLGGDPRRRPRARTRARRARTRSPSNRVRRSGKAVAAGERAAPDDDDQATKYELADDRLTAAGLSWYEVSNWARPGDECRHNLLYWQGGDYAAIGCAAHGHAQLAGGEAPTVVERPHARALHRRDRRRRPRRRRATRPSTPTPGPPRPWSWRCGPSRGIKLPIAGADPSGVATCIDDLIAAGLLARTGDRVVLTRRGRLLGNEVAARLLVALEQPSPVAGTR